jgi:hypothetical protein
LDDRPPAKRKNCRREISRAIGPGASG